MHDVPTHQTDFREQLKQRTQPLHDALEKSALAQSLASGTVSLLAYTTYLSQLYTLHAHIESAVTDFSEWKGYGIDPAQRRRLPMLIDDLKALGVDPLHLPTSFEWNHPWDFPTAVGVMYVLEGSTMGGLFLAQRLQQLVGNDGFPATRYFRGYGDQSVPMWGEYCRFLNLYASEHTESLLSITEGACAMFSELDRILRESD